MENPIVPSSQNDQPVRKQTARKSTYGYQPRTEAFAIKKRKLYCYSPDKNNNNKNEDDNDSDIEFVSPKRQMAFKRTTCQSRPQSDSKEDEEHSDVYSEEESDSDSNSEDSILSEIESSDSDFEETSNNEPILVTEIINENGTIIETVNYDNSSELQKDLN
jgi:hypothetical protein